MKLVRRDDAVVTISGRLDIAGAQGRRMGVKGAITVDEADILIPENLPKSITIIDVAEINTPPALRALVAQRRRAVNAPPVDLDLAITVPRRFFIRGRGILTELQGKLVIKGTSAKPVVDGSLRAVRGQIDLLGRRFAFTKALVRFGSPDLSDPLIDLLAEANAGDVKGIIRITGTAKRPKFEISSEPELPRDEVLARIIFGKDVASLTTSEAIRLAAGAALLFAPSSGASLPDRIRRSAGLDIIDINTDGGAPKAVLGKYVTDKVLVKIEQGATQDSTGVGVEVEVLKNFSVTGTARAEGSSRLGVKWRLDY